MIDQVKQNKIRKVAVQYNRVNVLYSTGRNATLALVV